MEGTEDKNLVALFYIQEVDVVNIMVLAFQVIDVLVFVSESGPLELIEILLGVQDDRPIGLQSQ